MQFESLNAELEHNQELANSRMAELEKLQLELQEAVRESEKLKVKMKQCHIFGAKNILGIYKKRCLFVPRWICGIFQKTW